MKKKTKSFSKKTISPFKALISVKIKHFEILFGLADVSFKYLKIHFRKKFLKASSSQKHEKTRFWPIFLLRFRHKTYHNSKWAELEKFSEKTKIINPFMETIKKVWSEKTQSSLRLGFFNYYIRIDVFLRVFNVF